jgi:UDP-N-acetylmuramyl pentapeptide phosphotransferase/UDP-N-acetylglucosamine-1-phosphate transferase
MEQAVIVLCWLWFINLTNFMDGIDGITCMQVIVMCVGICLISLLFPLPHALTTQASILAAAALGFFWFNRHPAKLFMGDVGSITLGFLMFYLLLSLSLNGALLSALILPAYYLSDATFTLLTRLLRREKIWQAHSSHAYQKAVRRGLKHTEVVHKITLLNICLVILAIFATADMMIGGIMLITAYIISAFTIRHLIYDKFM